MNIGIPLLNLLVFLGALATATFVIRSLRRSIRHLRLKLLWLAIALAIAVTAVYPAWLDLLLTLVGWGDRLNVALVIAVLFLLALNFRTLAKVERLETKLARSVEDLVLREYTPRDPYRGPDGARDITRNTPDRSDHE